jgi:nitrile hydratase accessory protein
LGGPEALLPREPDAGAPVFAEPWHAEVLALAYTLTEAGLFSAGEWADALGAEIRKATARDERDSDAAYYAAALAALEGLIARKSPDTGASLAPRVEAWRRAYLNTPHGHPVELAAGEDAHHHDLHDHDH